MLGIDIPESDYAELATLQGVLPREYACPGLDKTRLGRLIGMMSNITFTTPLPSGEGPTAWA